MQELIATFHIDWKLILAQLINFLIVAAVLYKFALKPLTKILTERGLTVKKSLEQAEAIEKKLAETEARTRQAVTEARTQAGVIIDQAKKQADDKRRELLDKAKTDVEGVIAKAKEQILKEKQEALRSAKQELAEVVVEGLRRVTDKEFSEKLDKKVIKNYIQHLR